MKLIAAFLVRDFQIEASYRLSFLVSLTSLFFRAFLFYFLSFLVGDAASPYLADYEGDYFSFVLIGIAFAGYFGVGLSAFANQLRRAQTTGTLEAMLVTPAPLSGIVIGSSVWNYAFTTFRVLVYLFIGTVLLGVDLSNANVAAAAVALVLSIIAFASIGIISASVIMVIKRGQPVTNLFGTAANLIGGVYYPIEVLPDSLQVVAHLLPITYSLRAMRLALLNGASWPALTSDLLALALFCLVALPLSLFAFRLAVQRARREGSLSHY